MKKVFASETQVGNTSVEAKTIAFRITDSDHIVRGALLAIVHKLFPEEIPTVNEYAKQTGIAPSTFSRAAEWLWSLLPALFRRRRPGPSPRPEEAQRPPESREESQKELNDLRLWLTIALTRSDPGRLR